MGVIIHANQFRDLESGQFQYISVTNSGVIDDEEKK